ncbi:hypothetical protein BWQ96_07055 [Gracilariopsis chorda]|uniref:Uncharacterized protein n=1 Tax=Gracilariopsis chorda TaxID=448386 RepID=A0A2V3IMB5_9FLOR|nr:hypothetical protein BWQ96_07055 [Gracilariopsis chorda]|eukprot:PXF43226.1 hypothetical protein BWQ96_07055 [Gracilariopsis chorda]
MFPSGRYNGFNKLRLMLTNTSKPSGLCADTGGPHPPFNIASHPLQVSPTHMQRQHHSAAQSARDSTDASKEREVDNWMMYASDPPLMLLFDHRSSSARSSD